MENDIALDGRRLVHVTAGLRRVLWRLEEMGSEPTAKKSRVDSADEPVSLLSRDNVVLYAEKLLAERRKRERFFDLDHFGEPQWDLMLDLFIAGKRGKQISVSSACIAACVPPTTALRHICVLTDRGDILRVPDKNDSRRIFLELSAEVVQRMENYLSETMASRA